MLVGAMCATVRGEARVSDDRSQQLQDEAAAARDAVLALVDGLSREQLDRPTTNEGWSIKDTLAHLGSIEARVRLMIRTVLDGGVWTGDQADLDAYNERCVAERHSWAGDAVISELRQSGQETAALFAQLTPENLDHEWTHPIRGPMTIEQTAGIVARHLRSHAEELRAALQG
jgi:uncharacterized protein (TIGR03083 family)